jgi:hypothetical protein
LVQSSARRLMLARYQPTKRCLICQQIGSKLHLDLRGHVQRKEYFAIDRRLRLKSFTILVTLASFPSYIFAHATFRGHSGIGKFIDMRIPEVRLQNVFLTITCGQLISQGKRFGEKELCICRSCRFPTFEYINLFLLIR